MAWKLFPHTVWEKSYETECTLADSPYSLVTIRYMLYEQWDQYIYLMAAMNRGSSLMAVRFTFCHCNEIYLAVMWSWGSVATRWPWRTTGCRVGWAVWALFVFEEGANCIKILITHCTSAIKSWLILTMDSLLMYHCLIPVVKWGDSWHSASNLRI